MTSPLPIPQRAAPFCWMSSCPNGQMTKNSWRGSPTYGRDVVSYCYLRFCTLCRQPWLTSYSVGLNVWAVAYLVLSGHFKGSRVCFCLTQSVATSCHKNESHSTSSYINKYLCNDYAIWIAITEEKVIGIWISMVRICQLSTKLGLLSCWFASLFARDHIPL